MPANIPLSLEGEGRGEGEKHEHIPPMSPISVEQNIQIIRALSNDLAGFLYTLPEDVWRDADVYASACDRWNMADVVAHLVDVAITFTMSIERAVNGSVSPPMGYRNLTAEERIESVISLRDAYGEDLFPEFNTSCLRLNRLIVGLEPDQYELPAWHPFRVMTVERLIELRAMELAVHGWDVRYGIDRSAAINPVAVPFLKDWVHGWLRACFRPQHQTAPDIRLRFILTDTTDEQYDLTVRADDFSLDPTDPSTYARGLERATDADATLELDSSSYILFLMGRLPLRRSVRRGRITLHGDQALAEQFPNWFPGV